MYGRNGYRENFFAYLFPSVGNLVLFFVQRYLQAHPLRLQVPGILKRELLIAYQEKRRSKLHGILQQLFLSRGLTPLKPEKLFTFYLSDTVNLYVSSLQVMFTSENSKYTFLCLFLIWCINYFCIWHPVFSHSECTLYLIHLILHNTYSRNPNTSSIRPSSNPLVALPAI